VSISLQYYILLVNDGYTYIKNYFHLVNFGEHEDL